MTTSELDICVADIEVYASMFLFCGYKPKENKRYQYEISWRKNEIDGLVKHLLEEIEYMVSYNGIDYDNQVLQYIIDKHSVWYDKTTDEIIELIYAFSQELISSQNYEQPPPYKEQHMDIKQIDVFKIFHYDNKNRRVGLKWLEFSMDMPDIEELPIDFRKEDISEQEIEDTIKYCWNDVDATYMGYNYVIGNCEHELYKNKDKIQLRLDLIAERGLPHIAINWNDGKIGDELNKRRYLELTGISNSKLWEKIKSRKTRTQFTFGECFPKYWKFDTKEYQEFFKRIAKTKVNLNEKQEFPFRQYMFAKGGGHSTESARIVKPNDIQMLIDCDVSSMYPWNIGKNKIYPAHLGVKWNEGYVENIPLRISAKKLFKESKEKKHESFAESYKYVLNINFGKLLDRQNWQYDPFAGMCTTIGGQIDIFMLAEDIEQISTAQVVSMNTDGLVIMIDREYEEQYKSVCEAWEKQVGNDVMGKLEYAEYEILVQTSVNDYIAVKKGDEPLKERVKKRGDFLTEYELHKNKSKVITAIALEAWYTRQIPVEDTIRSWPRINEFCIAKKSSRDYYYQGVNKKTGKVMPYNKLIRYYASVETGEKLYKMKHEHSDKTGPKQSVCESTSTLQTVCNHLPEYKDIKELNVDYGWYIGQTKKLLWQLEPETKRSDKIAASHQIQMFS